MTKNRTKEESKKYNTAYALKIKDNPSLLEARKVYQRAYQKAYRLSNKSSERKTKTSVYTPTYPYDSLKKYTFIYQDVVYSLVEAPSDIFQSFLKTYRVRLLDHERYLLDTDYELDSTERWYLVNRISGVCLSFE